MRINLLNRAFETLELYATSPALRHYFLSDNFVKGVAIKREEHLGKLRHATIVMLVVNTAFGLFDSLIGKTLPFMGTELTVEHSYAPFVCFLAAATFLRWVLCLLNNVLIDGYLAMLGKTAGMNHIELYTLPQSSSMIWGDVLGWLFQEEERGVKNSIAFAILKWVLFIFVPVFALYPTLVCLNYVFEAVCNENARLIELVVVLMSGFVILLSWFMISIFLIRFRQEPTELKKAVGNPKDFARGGEEQK